MVLMGVLVAVFLQACASVTELSSGGSRVRQISPEQKSECRFLGVVEASEGNGSDVQDDRRGAMNKIRNSVAASGGNGFVINDRSTSEVRTFIQVDAYACPVSR